jgi:hypothetical protein
MLVEALRQVAGAAGTCVLWIAWVLLVLSAGVQIYIAVNHELSVPDFVLRRLESRLAGLGLKARFDHALFDPTGRILVQSPQLFLPQLDDPIVTARAAYVGLDAWALATGHLEIREFRLVEGTVLVPALLSPSGRAEPLVRDVDAMLLPGTRELLLQHVSGRIGPLLVTVHGRVPSERPGGGTPAEIAGNARARFVAFCKTAGELTRRLDALDEPAVDLELSPAGGRGLLVSADGVARGLTLNAPIAAKATGLHVTTRFLIEGTAAEPCVARVEADDVSLPRGIELHHVSVAARGQLRAVERRIEPLDLDLAADSIITPDGMAGALSATAHTGDFARWQMEVVASVLGSHVGASGIADVKDRTATVSFTGSIAPEVLMAINHHVRVDVRKFFDFHTMDCTSGVARFGPDWKFQRLDAHVSLQGIIAHGIEMNGGEATVEVDPQRLHAPEAYAEIGPNFARGSYEQVFATREFRFLLDGRLRPLDIGGWFHPWWNHFFDRFAFPAEPPLASVDVRGVWHEGRQTSVFVFADSASPTIMGQKLGRVRTRLFIRPGFYDGLELFATDTGGASAHGTFNVTTNLDTGKWHSVDVDAASHVSFATAVGIGGELGRPFLSPFEVANPPSVTFRGHFDGPDLGEKRHERFDLEAHTRGLFKFEHLPFQDVAFTAALRDDDLTVDSTQAKFAGGAVRLHVKVTGPHADRRVAFDAAVSDASLGVAVNELQNFVAERKGLAHPAPGKFVQEKANVRADVTGSGEGKYADVLSFHGGGRVELRGAEIGEVPLFGPLSELLRFTALRFTTARSSYKINGPKLEFPDVTLRGANSAIDAHGEYALDRRQLDFRAKVFPFQESGNVIKTVVGAVLTPISNALEVKLTGTLEKPDWAFVIGPTNLIRSLAPTEPNTPGEPHAPADDNTSIPPRTPVTSAAGPQSPVQPGPPAASTAAESKPKVD